MKRRLSRNGLIEKPTNFNLLIKKSIKLLIEKFIDRTLINVNVKRILTLKNLKFVELFEYCKCN